MKSQTRKLACVSLISGLLIMPLLGHAAVKSMVAEQCTLGATCTIPGNDGGVTYFQFTPQSGTEYKCDIKLTKGDKLVVMVYEGRNFYPTSGEGFYSVTDTTSIKISGEFHDPNNPTQIGQIKFLRFTDTEGTVTCNVAS